MAKTVKINRTATLRVSAIAEYLEAEFSYQTAENFVNQFYKTIDKIVAHPTRGRKVPKSKTLQFLNMDKNRQIFYRVHGSRVSIVDVFDTRQDPNKRPTD
jgi:plasmid stabilization system protein ParE